MTKRLKPNGEPYKILSLRKFLRTGNLGPLNPSANLMDVARLLGTPEAWSTPDYETFPLYWYYDRLEISFHPAAPHQIYFFQLEHTYNLTPSGGAIGDDFWLDPDGFDGTMKPSDLLRARLWRQSDVHVLINAGPAKSVVLEIGGLHLIFAVNIPRYPYTPQTKAEEAAYWAEVNAVDAHHQATNDAIAAASEAGDLASLVALSDANATGDSIYSYPPKPEVEWTRPATDFYEMNGERYLALLEKSTR